MIGFRGISTIKSKLEGTSMEHAGRFRNRRGNVSTARPPARWEAPVGVDLEVMEEMIKLSWTYGAPGKACAHERG